VTTEARITYSQDWPAYNRAQCEERRRVELLLRGLCDGIEQPPHPGRGRKPALFADVVYAAAMKVYGTMSGRRSTGDVQACAERGLVNKAPAYNTLFKYAERAELAPLLKALVYESAAPLRAVETTFATDSTGFATSTQTFTWTVTDVNRAPVLAALADQTSVESATVALPWGRVRPRRYVSPDRSSTPGSARSSRKSSSAGMCKGDR